MSSETVVHIPGKLFIAGEYAVMEAGTPAVIVAVDRYLTVTLERSEDDGGSIYSAQIKQPMHWQRQNKHLVPVEKSVAHHYSMLLHIIQFVETYIQEAYPQKKLHDYHITITSQLDDPLSGKKYGLGSSGAVTVGIIEALLLSYRITLSKLQRYKLAVLCQLDYQLNGSFGDIAASTFGGWIVYRMVDRSWLETFQKQHSLHETITNDWQQLQIIPIQIPASLRWLVGWTHSPASTAQLVFDVQTASSPTDVRYRSFIQKSHACVEQLIQACHLENTSLFLQAIETNRKLLLEFAQTIGITIETPQLQRLCTIAKKHASQAKTSGAGGGDCGIAFAPSPIHAHHIIAEWRLNGIEPLMLQPAFRIEKGDNHDII